MPGCKAPEILSREAYFDVRRAAKDKGNAADGRFSTAGPNGRLAVVNGNRLW
jgi:hypothetical protein